MPELTKKREGRERKGDMRFRDFKGGGGRDELHGRACTRISYVVWYCGGRTHLIRRASGGQPRIRDEHIADQAVDTTTITDLLVTRRSCESCLGSATEAVPLSPRRTIGWATYLMLIARLELSCASRVSTGQPLKLGPMLLGK